MADYQELVEVDFGKDKDLALVRYSLQNLQTADYPAGTGLASYADPYTRAVRASFQIFYYLLFIIYYLLFYYLLFITHRAHIRAWVRS